MAVKNKTKTKSKAKKKRSKNITKPVQPSRLIAAIAAVLMIAILLSVAAAAKSKRPAADIYDFNKEIAAGIDVSEHNGAIDWEKAAIDFDFTFIRVGYRGYSNGDILEDKYAKDNMKAAEKAGIPFGVYFYSQAATADEAIEEADFVLNKIKHFDIKLPVIIDFEYATDEDGNRTGRLAQAGLSPKENTQIINTFCKRVSQKGYQAGVYASSSVLKNEIITKELDSQTIIWAADYNNSVTYNIDYDIWQYSKAGKSDAVSSKYVDLNYWYTKK